jgi:uncharacterized OB-fold protein
MTFARPPLVGQDDQFFWDGVADRTLLLQRCSACGQMRHPPRPMCPACRSLEWETFASTGRGSVLSYVIPRHPVPPGFDDSYVVVLVELDEGARIVSSFAGDLDDVRNDLPVEVVYEPVEPDGRLMHRFRAAPGPAS